MSSRPKLKLDWCSHEAAKYAVEHWHYSRCLPRFKQLWIGVWEGGAFIGIVSFGQSSTPYLGDAYGLTCVECAELTRVALARHVSPVSRIISIAVRMVKKQSPGIRLLVSLADPAHGHIGAIYQAGNWVYIGVSSMMTQFYFRGKWRNDSSLMRYLQVNPHMKETLKRRRVAGKHKYLMPLDKEMRERIEPLRKPYPKRAGSIDSDATSDQDGKGGASPTSALQ